MNEVEVERQIDQMVRFIKQEAEEKANEISVSAEEDFNIEKLQLLEKERNKIKKEYERREGQIEVKKKIGYSKQLNDSRIKVLQAQEDAVQSLLHEAHDKLSQIVSDKKGYKSLMTDLIAQAAHKLAEPSASVRVREVDVPLAKEALEAAKSKYSKVYGKEAPSLTLDTTTFLAPAKANNADEDTAACAGGVVLLGPQGKIVCSNTLDDRLRIAYTQTLPCIRAALLGAPQRA